MDKVTLLLLNDQGLSTVECGELEDYYGFLECRVFDIASRKIGGKYFDIFCDDEGLFAEEPRVSAVSSDGNEIMLVGNLIFANHDAEGNTTSLSEDDVELIMNNQRKLINLETGRVNPVVLCDY